MHRDPTDTITAYISGSRGLRIVMRNADLLSGLREPIIDCIHLQSYSVYASSASVSSQCCGMCACPHGTTQQGAPHLVLAVTKGGKMHAPRGRCGHTQHR